MSNIDNFISIGAYVWRQKKIPNICNPKSLTDKILKIKLSQNADLAKLRSLVSDRLLVRDYVSSKSESCNLIKLLWSGKELTESVWEKMPNKFVIKANHGSKMVKIVSKKAESLSNIKSLTDSWLQLDYYKKGREWVYKDLERTLVIEEFIEFDGDVPPDYKFFCLNGEVCFVQVDLDRYNGHSRNIYPKDFKLLDVEYNFPKGYDIEKPLLYNKALNIVNDLSLDFDFIRVDLYILKDQVYFGELTNFPGNCLEHFTPNSFDFEMGKKLTLGVSK